MGTWLKQSTAVTLRIGPFVDQTDGFTAETLLTISQADVRLSKNHGAFAQKGDASSCTHEENGYYQCPLSTADTGTLGPLKLAVNESGALPVWHDYVVVAANVFDSLIGGGDNLDVQVAGMDAGVVTAAAVATGAIDADAIAADAITSAKIANGAIDAATFAAGAIDAAAVAADAVTEIRSVASGTADSGTVNTLVDAARTEADTDYWKGAWLVVTSGNIAGQARKISAFTPASDTITVDRDFTQAVGTNTYEIWVGDFPDEFAELGIEADGHVHADIKEWLGAAPNALVTGRVDTSTGAMAAGVVTAAAVATDAIDADALATDAVDEIVDGVWDENIVSAHGGADSAGLTLSEITKRSVTFGTAVVAGSVIDQLADDGTASYDRTTDSLQALRDRGDAAWTTGGGSADPALLQNTTITGLSSQTVFNLTAGSADDDAYNGCVIVITDSATSTQKAVGVISDYAGSTKTVTLQEDPGIFVMANGDTVDILADRSLKASTALQTLQVEADGHAHADIKEWLGAAPNALVTGRVDTSTGAMAAGVVTAAAVATDAIDADALATDAVDEIVDGVWDENIVSAHGGADSAGLTVSELTKRSVTFATAVVAGSVVDQVADDGTAAFDRTTDSLQAIRDRGDAAWTTGGGGSDPSLLQNTTIATLASQTSFTLTAGSADDDAYNGCVIVITDSVTAEQKAVGTIKDYTGSTKTITLTKDPGIFTMAVGDTVDIIAGINLDRLQESSGTIVHVTVQTGSTDTVVETDLTEITNDHYNGRLIFFTSGALADETSSISDYDGTNKRLTVVQLTEAPANGDRAIIV